MRKRGFLILIISITLLTLNIQGLCVKDSACSFQEIENSEANIDSTNSIETFIHTEIIDSLAIKYPTLDLSSRIWVDSMWTVYIEKEDDSSYLFRRDFYQEISTIYEKNADFEKAFEYYYYFTYFGDSARIVERNKNFEKAQKKYETQKTRNELEFVNNTSSIQQLKIRNHNYLIYGIAVLIVLVLLITFLFIQNNVIKTKNKIAEIAQLNLRQQLNPEFIFNTLNSIQYSLFLKDRNFSHKILSKFAKLMRSILDNSQNSTIPLKKEFEEISLFLELEQLKLKDTFTYQLSIDPNLDLVDNKIPPLIIHSFIDNIIEPFKHEKLIKVNLQLDFSLYQKKLKCSIIEKASSEEAGLLNMSQTPYGNSKLDLIKSIYQKIEFNEISHKTKDEREILLHSEILIPIQNQDN